MGYEEQTPQKESIQELLKKYQENKDNMPMTHETKISNSVINDSMPKPPTFNPQDFEKTMSRETDPDLIISYEIVKLIDAKIIKCVCYRLYFMYNDIFQNTEKR